MKRLIMMATLTASLFSCGTVCDRFKSSSDSLETKGKACSDYQSGGVTFNKTKCDEGISKCNADDVKKLNAYLDCLDKAGTCSGNYTAWALTNVLGCASNIGGLSAECTAAVNN